MNTGRIILSVIFSACILVCASVFASAAQSDGGEIHAEFSDGGTGDLFNNNHTYSGSFASSSESDTYILTAKTRGAIVCELTHGKLSAGAYRVRLYMKYSTNGDGSDEAWRLINELETTAADGKYTTSETGVLPGIYKAVVSCLNKNTPDKEYTASFVFIESNEYECEYNDTMTRYNEISAGQDVKGSASYFSSGKDCDWYMFRVYENSAMSFVFEHEKKDLTSVCWIISVYDADGNELYSDNSYFSTESLRSGKIGMQKGCYFVKIESRVYNSATYSLKIYKNTDTAYESESNDTRESANAIKAGTAVTGELSSRSSGSDIDFYKLTLAESGICRFVFSHEPDADEVKSVNEGESPKNGWRITVTDANGTAIYSGLSSWDSSETKSPELGLGEGIYYVQIDSENLRHNKTPYTLNVSFESSSAWEQEPNGTFETADRLLSSTAKSGTISSFENGDSDSDYYYFTVTDTCRVTVALNHGAVVGKNYSIFEFGLYSSSHEKVALTDERGLQKKTKNNEPVYTESSFGAGKAAYAYATLEPGTYYVKVTAGKQYDSMRYKLTFTTEVTK